MLDADERQEWTHNAGKIAEMTGILWKGLLDQGIGHELAESLMLEWWRSTLAPKVELPDFGAMLRGIGEDES